MGVNIKWRASRESLITLCSVTCKREYEWNIQEETHVNTLIERVHVSVLLYILHIGLVGTFTFLAFNSST